MSVRKININDATKRIADLFRDTLPELPNDARLIKLTDEYIKRLKKSRCETENISFANSKITSFYMPENSDDNVDDESSYYIMIVGDFSLPTNEYIFELEITSEWLYPWASFFVPKLRDGVGKDEINQFIWPYTQQYGSVDQDELLRLFPSFKLYRVQSPLNGDSDLKLIVNMAYLDQPQFHGLEFSQSLINEFKCSLADTKPDIETLTKAFTADRWEYCFFTLYQCIEPLFNNLLAKTLKEALEISEGKDHMEITEILKKNALVIPDESSVITVMYSKYLSEELRETFCDIFNRPKTGEHAMNPGAIGRHIYSIRNKIVHHPQSASTKKELDSNMNLINEMKSYNWDRLCLTLLKTYRCFKRQIPT